MRDNLFYVWIVFSLVLCLPLQSTATSTEDKTIKIGGGFALTGDLSLLDQSAAKGAKLAVKEINEAGGVNGRQIDLIMHDTQSKLDKTAQVCRQFVEHDKVVAVIGFTDTDSVLACGPAVQKAGLPFITVGATSPKIPQQIGNKTYLACFGDNEQAAVGAEFGFKKFGKNAYVLWDTSADYTTLLAKYFKDRFNQLGGVIVLEDSYNNKITEYSSQITKIKALPQEPDFYFISAMPYNVGQVVKQFRAAGLMRPIIGGDGYDTGPHGGSGDRHYQYGAAVGGDGSHGAVREGHGRAGQVGPGDGHARGGTGDDAAGGDGGYCGGGYAGIQRGNHQG